MQNMSTPLPPPPPRVRASHGPSLQGVVFLPTLFDMQSCDLPFVCVLPGASRLYTLLAGLRRIPVLLACRPRRPPKTERSESSVALHLRPGECSRCRMLRSPPRTLRRRLTGIRHSSSVAREKLCFWLRVRVRVANPPLYIIHYQ